MRRLKSGLDANSRYRTSNFFTTKKPWVVFGESVSRGLDTAGNLRNRTKDSETGVLVREAYRIPLEKWRKGYRQICFPAGTWWMKVHHGV